MPRSFHVKTGSRIEMVDITANIQAAISETGTADGICTVFVPHTTAGITVNEGADPAVCQDQIRGCGVVDLHPGRTHLLLDLIEQAAHVGPWKHHVSENRHHATPIRVQSKCLGGSQGPEAVKYTPPILSAAKSLGP